MISKNGKKLNILGIIPARGGSKRLPRKNIKLLCGKPLISYSIEEAKKSKLLDRLFVVTEDEEIYNVAKSHGVELIKEPEHLAGDKVVMEDVLIHTVKTVVEEHKFNPHIIVLLQPTTPYRTAETIDEAIKKLVEHPEADAIVSVYKAPQHYNPHWVSKIHDDGYIRPYIGEKYVPLAQLMPEVYWRDGQVYAVYTEKLLETGSRYGNKCIPYINREDRYHINIDDELDFMLAELLIEKGLIKP